MAEPEEQLRAYVEYFRDLGVYDFYRRGERVAVVVEDLQASTPVVEPAVQQNRLPEEHRHAEPPVAGIGIEGRGIEAPVRPVTPPYRESLEPSIPKLVSFNDLAPLPTEHIAAADRPAALKAIQEEIGDCT